MTALLGAPAPAFALPVSELHAQVQALRERNQMIRAKLDRQKALTQQLKQRIDSLGRKDEAIAEQVQGLAERPAAIVEPAEVIPVPKLTIKLFGDTGYTWLRTDRDVNDNAFWIGRQEIFFGGALSEKLSAGMEVVLPRERFEPEVPRPRLDRGFVRYNLADALNVQAGMVHTPIGYWSETFQHGAWLQTPVFEPEIFTTGQGEVLGNRLGGWLPLHNVGIDASGTLALPGADLGYNVGLFNGRGGSLNRLSGGVNEGDAPEDAVSDKNDFKAINARLSVAPAAFSGGVKLGAGIYIDEIPPETRTSVVAAQRFLEGMGETIASWFLAYNRGPAELLGETFYIRHRDHSRNYTFRTWAHYLQAGYRLREKYTPYYRFDYLDFGNGDPFWDQIDFDVAKHTIGLRWDVSDWNALKLEYSHASFQGQPGQAVEDEQQVVVNSSWAF